MAARHERSHLVPLAGGERLLEVDRRGLEITGLHRELTLQSQAPRPEPLLPMLFGELDRARRGQPSFLHVPSRGEERFGET